MLRDTWVVSMSWLLYLVLLWTLGWMYLFEWEFSFFSWFIPKSGIAESYGSFILICLFVFKEPPYCTMWLYQFVFPSQCRRVPFSPDPLQHLYLGLLIISILTSARCSVAFLYSKMKYQKEKAKEKSHLKLCQKLPKDKLNQVERPLCWKW